MSLVSLVVMPLWKVGKFFYVPGRLDKVKRKNVNITLGILVTVALFVLFLPLPYRVMCTLEIKPRDAEPRLRRSCPACWRRSTSSRAKQVKTGDVLGRLSNIDLDARDRRLGGANRASKKLAGERLHTEQFELHERIGRPAIARSREIARSLREQLAEKKQRSAAVAAGRARRTAPCCRRRDVPPAGPRHRRTAEMVGQPAGDRRTWRLLDPATLFCQIGDPAKWEAILVVDQDDIEFIRERSAGGDQARRASLPTRFTARNRRDRPGTEGHAASTVEQIAAAS